MFKGLLSSPNAHATLGPTQSFIQWLPGVNLPVREVSTHIPLQNKMINNKLFMSFFSS
jgi:hypothetical protein